MSNKNIKVAVAMSGGVDSSVAAALLKNEGFDVFGLTMHLWDYHSVGGNIHNDKGCCSLEDIYDARHVCEHLGIPHYVIDAREKFEEHIVNDFVSEYMNGRTPNPCILCNSVMKWQALLRKAKQLNASFIATGHYARVQFLPERNRYCLLRGADRTKDQSYALWALTQDQLSHTKLPLGSYTKFEVRDIAEKFELKTVQKIESQEICFIPDNNYRRFLKERVPEKISGLQNGEIVNINGDVLGYHEGYPNFTIGQRRKLGIAVGRPQYVVEIDPEKNRIVVGDQEDLKKEVFYADYVNWIAIERLRQPMSVVAKIRYNDPGGEATVYPMVDNRVKVVFKNARDAITPGQSAVFFQDNLVLGGGIIDLE